MKCLDVLAVLSNEMDGLMSEHAKTVMEMEAVKAARLPLYNALVAIGIEAAFDGLSATQIDGIIMAIWDGVRASMHQQSARGDVPF
jgi:hypothetical protein